MTTEAQQAALEKAHVDTAYFAELAFSGGTLRLSNLGTAVTWGGYEWQALGSLGSIDAIQESDSLTPQALNFTLSVADSSLLALAIGPVEEYRGLAAKLYRCPLNSSSTLIDTPELCWRGIMDMMSVGVGDDGAGQIVLKCETSSYGLKRRPALRMNAAQQKKRHPNDTSFNRLNDLIAKPALWLTVKFQRQ